MKREPMAHRIEDLSDWPTVTTDDFRATLMAILVLVVIVILCSLYQPPVPS
jgi:hypothetical protein